MVHIVTEFYMSSGFQKVHYFCEKTSWKFSEEKEINKLHTFSTVYIILVPQQLFFHYYVTSETKVAFLFYCFYLLQLSLSSTLLPYL